ncbi:MAG: site-specific integrase, partial [Patescibacteria group bacterium]
MDLQKYQQEFVASLRSKSRASATVIAYGQDINQLNDHLQKQDVSSVKDITTAHLESFLTGLSKQNYTAKSISRKINSIKTFFRYLSLQNFLTTNPSLTIVHPKIEAKLPRILSQTEYRALRDACREDNRISAIVELFLQTGIRIGELANLSVSDA